MKRFALISAVGAVVLVASPPPRAWSQSTPTTQQQSQPESSPRPPLSGDRDGRPPFRPGLPPPPPPGERRFGGGGGAGGPDGMRGPREWRRSDGRPDFAGPGVPAEPTEEEWKEVVEFMKKYSPKRLEQLENVGDDKRQETIRAIFAGRYRAMEELKERDKEIHDIRLARMPLEDEVFAMSWEVAHSQASRSDADQNKLRENQKKLRELVRQLVKSRLQERAVHLKRMEKRLHDDEQRLEALVDANLADIADERMPRDLRPQLTPPRRRMEGGGDNNPSNASPTPTAPTTGD